MEPYQRSLLRRIAEGQRDFGNRDLDDPDEGLRFDREVRALRELESRGWISLVLQRNFVTSRGDWYLAVATLTGPGRDALKAEPAATLSVEGA